MLLGHFGERNGIGRAFLRVIGMVFDTYLRRRDAGRPLFSRTV